MRIYNMIKKLLENQPADDHVIYLEIDTIYYTFVTKSVAEQFSIYCINKYGSIHMGLVGGKHESCEKLIAMDAELPPHECLRGNIIGYHERSETTELIYAALLE